ncbi:hypothetical protein O7626_39890 [Micromonospora sp. WMMD1102]|uniref:hypothetical protein n=1 Tax=Micromonospora sp. WMMD1102 TaxID=3016105 RepID=UPI00241569EA|nr:hypothetical protein [Micromonospora sp. WMMD1102]MDG4791978.1 hypothetical protein [Micromonospora sp. WMMD1102]
MQTGAEATALDEAARAFQRTEALLDRQREDLWNKIVAACRAGMSKAEAARRTGYSREYVSDLVKAANERDGWAPEAS